MVLLGFGSTVPLLRRNCFHANASWPYPDVYPYGCGCSYYALRTAPRRSDLRMPCLATVRRGLILLDQF